MSKLVLKNISKSFMDSKGRFEVLKKINISAKSGEIVVILGPSGCGKTILLYLIAGFLESTSGSIFVDNKKVSKPDPSRMMIFQQYVLFPWKTVYENVLFALDSVTTKLSKDKKKKLVMKYLDLVGLSEFSDWYIHKLSGGMQQRVAIARALIVNPKILLMDEPFAAVDSQYRKFLRNSLEEIWQKTKKTIVFVTHSMNEAICIADKIYLLSARPAVIRKVYKVDLPRPRRRDTKEFAALARDIELQMSKEFKKIKDQVSEDHMDEIYDLRFREKLKDAQAEIYGTEN